MSGLQNNSANHEESIITVEFSEIEEDPTLAGVVLEALTATAEGEERTVRRIAVVLTNDEQLHKLNFDYSGIDAPTDVLSFDLSDGDDSDVEGDIYISLDRAAEQAAQINQPLSVETTRLAVHGFLHLCGWDHEDDEELKLMVDKGEIYVSRATDREA